MLYPPAHDVNSVQLSGSRLKFDPAEADGGLFLALPFPGVRWRCEAVETRENRRPRRAIVQKMPVFAPRNGRALFLVATAGGETEVTSVQKNKPSQLVFLVPATLPGGTYHLEVRARMGTGTSSRQLRIGRLDATLTCFPP